MAVTTTVLMGCSGGVGADPDIAPSTATEHGISSSTPTEMETGPIVGTTEQTSMSTAGEGDPIYQDFEDVDPYLHSFFITLEDTGLAEGHGERALWNYGTRTCKQLDAGGTVQERVDEFEEYDLDVAVIAAAVNHICDRHRAAVQQWADDNS